jgi:arabinose-5-phosphate isomerase
MMALGDALAVALMEARGFGREDYARLHPAGSLGRRLLLHVSDVMRKGEDVAIVPETDSVHAALFAITRAGAGAACIVDEAGRMSGILTDGDVRRLWLEGGAEMFSRPVREAMTRSPRAIHGDPLAAEALPRFERPDRAPIGDLPVLDDHGRPVGMLMLKDLLRAGIV